VRIDIQHFDINAEFCGQWRKRYLHVVTEMAISTRHQGQFLHTTPPFYQTPP
jgi:hypothetical protein